MKVNLSKETIYNKDSGFIEKECAFESDGLFLNGTLAMPKEKRAPHCVLLLPGSGPVDRDENIKKFFRGFITNNLKIIAHNLALNGFASFRYDKRRKSKTDRDLKKIGFKNLLNDAEKAIDFLLSIDELDSNKVFIIGHSEGGVIGTILASENKVIKGLISVASPVSPFDKIFIDQIDHILKVNNQSKEKVEAIIKALTETFTLMRERKSWDKIKPEEIKKLFSTASKIIRFLPAKTCKKIIAKQVRPEWFIQSFDYDIYKIASMIKCPVLIISGEKDYQIPVNEAKLFEKSLKDGGNDSVDIKIISNLNHMLRYNDGPMNPKTSIRSIKKEDLDKTVIETMVGWLKQHE